MSTKKSPAKKKVAKKKVSKSQERRVQIKSKKDFSVTLEVNEQVFEAQGATAHEAIEAVIPAEKTLFPKTFAVLTLKSGKLSAQQRFYVVPFRRFLVNRLMREIWAKRLSTMLR